MPRNSPQLFLDQIERAPPPACLVSGDETQLVDEVRTAICRHFDAENRHIIDLDRPPESEMIGAGKGLFGGGAEVFQLFSSGKPSAAGLALVDKLHQRIEEPDAMVLLVMEWDYKYKKAAWFKELSERMPTVLCDRLTAREGRTWLRRWSAAEELQLSDDMLELLSFQTEGNLFAAKQAIAKLALAGGAPPGEQALRAALADGAKYDVLDLSDAIYAGKPLRALAVLRQLRADHTAETLIQWNVMNIVNNIVTVKSNGRPLAWGWQLNALHTLAGKTSEPMLARLMRHSAHADRALKGVAGGENMDILCGIIMRLAMLQSGAKMTLPYTRL